MLTLRSALFNVIFYALLIVLMVAGLPTLLFGHRAVLRLSRLWATASMALLRIICGTRIVLRGGENLPRVPCIVASKHQSFIEIIAFCTFFDDYTFVLKRELTRIPLFGWYLSASRQIAIDRAQGRSALTTLTRRAVEALKEGRCLILFPEGTRRPPSAPAEYRSGISLLYSEAGVPCLPVAVNSGLFWPRRSFLRRPGSIVIEFLPVIPSGLPRADFQARMRDTIETSSQALMREAIQAEPRLAHLLNRVPESGA